jgi:hypothetical protein
MRFSATLGAALLASGAYAADDQKVVKDDKAAADASSTSPAVELPTFTVSSPLSRPELREATAPAFEHTWHTMSHARARSNAPKEILLTHPARSPPS